SFASLPLLASKSVDGSLQPFRHRAKPLLSRGAAVNDSPMMQHEIVDRTGDEQRAAEARIAAAEKLLRGGKDKVPEVFAALLFGRAAPEDIVVYDPAEIATLARE